MELEAARALVPGWVFPAAVLVHAGAAFLVAFALGAALFLLGRRAILRPAPWPVRARALYPPRAAMAAAAWVLPLAAGVCLAIGRRGFLGGDGVVIGSAVVASVFPLAFWQRRLTCVIVVSGHTLSDTLAGFATRALMLRASIWTVLLIAVAMPLRPGAVGAALLVAGAILLVLIARGGGFAAARALGLAPPAPHEITERIRAVAEKAKVPLAGVHQVRLPESNAFALPGRIVFTRAALWKVEVQGLLAIAQHEIAHLSEPPSARRKRIAGALSLLPVVCAKPIYAAAGLPVAGLVVVLSLFLRRALRRRVRPMETRADVAAGAATYARALEEVYRLNLVPVVRGSAAYPDLPERLKAIGAVPTCPTPPAPSRALRLALGALIGLAVAVDGLWWETGAREAEARGHLWAAVALDGGEAWTLVGIASSREPGEAALLCAAAGALETDSPYWPAYESMSLVEAGRIDEAKRALAEAEERARAWEDPPLDLLAEAGRRVGRAR